MLQSIITGGNSSSDLSKHPDVSISQSGTDIVLTITPQAASAKAQRRMMFTSFVITIDTKTSEIKSLRMNEKGQNYTQYDFSSYSFQ